MSRPAAAVALVLYCLPCKACRGPPVLLFAKAASPVAPKKLWDHITGSWSITPRRHRHTGLNPAAPRARVPPRRQRLRRPYLWPSPRSRAMHWQQACWRINNIETMAMRMTWHLAVRSTSSRPKAGLVPCSILRLKAHCALVRSIFISYTLSNT